MTALVPGGGYAEFCVAHETQRPADPRRPDGDRGGGDSRNLLHRLDQCLRPRRAESRRDASGSWGDVRHRHDRDHARQGVRGEGRSRRRDRTRRRPNASGSGPTSASITGPTISSPRTLAATKGRGADVILDMVGGDYVARNYAAAALDGRIVQIAFMQAQKATIDLRPLMHKRLIHTGSTLRARSPAEKAVDRRGPEGEGLAAAGSRALQAGDQFGLPARGSRQGACADRERRACRQDRV